LTTTPAVPLLAAGDAAAAGIAAVPKTIGTAMAVIAATRRIAASIGAGSIAWAMVSTIRKL
jgi:hypothetical protein